MNRYYFMPQVAGELGPETEFLSSCPTVVGAMEYLFDEWPSSEFVAAHPCFAVSNNVNNSLECSGLRGFSFAKCKVGASGYFEGSADVIPSYSRFFPTGKFEFDDFSLSEEGHLVVSLEAKNFLERFDLRHCQFFPWGEPFPQTWITPL